MTRFVPLLSALALAACGSGGSSANPDLCTQAVTSSEHVANELNACAFGDAGVTTAVTTSAIAACNQALSSCTPADQKILGTQAACIAKLTAFSCGWYTEKTMGVVDAGLSQWVDAVAACQPSQSLSLSCPGLGSLVPVTCGENVCAPPLICQSTPSCGEACVCQRDADCPSDQRCGPTGGCGNACFRPPTL